MRYAQLKEFIEQSMRMSHIYQPVMIRVLLESGGSATEEEIAKSLLSHDRSQIEYYCSIVCNMVGRILRSHGIVDREGRTYRLAGFDGLSFFFFERTPRFAIPGIGSIGHKNGEVEMLGEGRDSPAVIAMLVGDDDGRDLLWAEIALREATHSFAAAEADVHEDVLASIAHQGGVAGTPAAEQGKTQ